MRKAFILLLLALPMIVIVCHPYCVVELETETDL
jgi:hypothetical protein